MQTELALKKTCFKVKTVLTYEKQKGTTLSLESRSGRRICSLPSLNRISVGSVLDVTEDITLYFSALFGDLATSIFPNFRFFFPNLIVIT